MSSYNDKFEKESIPPNTTSQKAYSVKFIAVGDSYVGKSCITTRFVKDKFEEDRIAAIGVEFGSRQIIYNNTNYLVQIWDTAGLENFKSIIREYYKESAVAILVYDITNVESFNNIKNWLEDCKYLAPSKTLLVLIGNKIDKEEERAVTKEIGEEFATENGMLFFETSALSGIGIENVFQKCVENIDKRINEGFYDLNDMSGNGIKKMKNKGENNVLEKKTLTKENKKKKKCCLQNKLLYFLNFFIIIILNNFNLLIFFLKNLINS